MVVSDWYSDEELKSQIQGFFDVDEEINFNTVLGTLSQIDENTYQVIVKNRVFQFGKESCDVREII